MIDFTVYVLPLVVLAIANFVLSWLWYSPLLFAKPWMKALGIDERHEMTEQEKKRMPVLFLSGLGSSFLVVYGMMVMINSLNVTDFAAGLCAGAVIWAGFALTHSLNTLWEGRKPLVLAINNGLFLLTYALYGGILAVWR
jgi:UDP-N-acetylmuramyl pentapeptide phosphotransferase/UDP-N-acetylglucosamine-1-phosphate transferase